MLILTLIFLDQFSKRYALYKLNRVYAHEVLVGIFRFSIVKNLGAAFGIMAKRPMILKVVTSVIIILLFVYTSLNIFYDKPTGEILSLSFIIGGALGNYIDRIRHGYVIDFISLNIKHKRFPVFNFADFFIIAGCGILFFYL